MESLKALAKYWPISGARLGEDIAGAAVLAGDGLCIRSNFTRGEIYRFAAQARTEGEQLPAERTSCTGRSIDAARDAADGS